MKTQNQIKREINSKMNYASDFIKVKNCEVEIYVELNGQVDYQAIDTIQSDFVNIFGWGGFKTGYGSWILQPNYKSINID